MRGEAGQKTFTALKFRTQCPLVLPVKVARKEGKALRNWGLTLTEIFSNINFVPRSKHCPSQL
jgi:hypothetical protein